MLARVQKWGNSLAVRIPKAMAVEAHLAQEVEVDLSVIEGELIIKPFINKKKELVELISRINKDNIHNEDIWGAPVGKEVW